MSLIHKTHDDGWHGQIAADSSSFPPEAGRYHLYIGLFCPFAHRVNIVRYLVGLESLIDISVVRPYPKGNEAGWPGWKFPKSDDEYPAATVDALFGSEYLHEVYFKVDSEYKGRYSVPLLWDKKQNTAVNNESAELLRWLPTAFDSISPKQHSLDLYPQAQRAEIEHISAWMQKHLNTGVYKAGFAESQEKYDENVPYVFAALNKCEALLHANGGPYMLGKALTILDIQLYCTLIRFDVVYHQHFKCNLGMIRHDYPVLHAWMRNLYWNVGAFRDSTDFKHIKENYTKSHPWVNPKAITPLGPYPDIETGFETDFATLKPGKIEHPEVLKAEETF